jgi:hypothetical protein
MRICDTQHEKAARVEAFLAVPLYSKIFEQFSGKTLPPPAGLESLMANLGVSVKQTERARQAFQRSAKLAGFFDFGAERLVKPPIGRLPVGGVVHPPPLEPPKDRGQGHVGDTYDPLIEGLLKRLPAPDASWGMDARKKWLQAALNIFDVMYTAPDGESTIVIEIKTAGGQ